MSDFVIENTGTSAITPVIEWWLVPTINSWAGALYLQDTTHSNLATNAWFLTSRTLTIPATIPPGDYYLGAFIDMQGDSVSDNNSTWLDRLMTITEPDLIVLNPSVTQTILLTGESFTASASAHNQGTGASAATTLRYYVSTNSYISKWDTQIGSDPVTALGVGFSSLESEEVNAPATVIGTSPVGAYWVGACVDAVAGESVTTNECSSGVAIVATNFTDEPLTGLPIKAVDFTELRERINAQLVQLGKPEHSYTDSIVVGAVIRGRDLTEMYEAVNDALSAAQSQTIAVPTITPTMTIALASHVHTLRNAVLTLEGVP